MADILLYIKREQVKGVFERGDVGSGQKPFGGWSQQGGRVFVASDTNRGPAFVGEIPIDEPYEDRERQDGWIYRIRATTRLPRRYDPPVMIVAGKGQFEFLQDAEGIRAAIHRCRRLTQADADLISKLGKSKEPVRPPQEPDVVDQKILLDEGFAGLADFIRDDGWATGSLAKAATDDAVLDRARAEGSIVVAADEKLLERCRRKGVEVIDVGFKGQLAIVEGYLRAKRQSTS